MVSNKVIFALMIFLSVVLLVSYWIATNILQARNMAYIYSLGIVSMILIGMNALTYKQIKSENKKGIGIFLGKLIFDVVILMIFSYLNPDFGLYYIILSVIANTFILISIQDDLHNIERKDTDFHLSIHDKDSPIPPNMIIPFYSLMFFLYGGLIWFLGNTLISYPIFSFLGDLIGALPNSFGVGDSENIVIIIFVFALSEWLMKKIGMRKGTYNKYAVFIVSLLVALTSFELYHTLIYKSNIAGQLSVAIFGFMGITIYKATKSLICSLTPLHDSNNFFGTIFKRTQFGQSVIGIGAEGNFILSLVIPILMIVLIIAIVLYLRRKRR